MHSDSFLVPYNAVKKLKIDILGKSGEIFDANLSKILKLIGATSGLYYSRSETNEMNVLLFRFRKRKSHAKIDDLAKRKFQDRLSIWGQKHFARSRTQKLHFGGVVGEIL
ncbi:hypothetical protein C8J57DRAFT_1223529 [Mycena rebaudengoi]|nr:hypothetical protein C8J57DRAFT_1223529 [Mycena rebaudengoi]